MFMEQFKRVQVIMLPTDKGTIVKKNITNELKLSSLNNPLLWIPQHLYIISDDKIKKDDYYILFTDKALTVLKCTGDGDYFNCKKIIATTDTSLYQATGKAYKMVDGFKPTYKNLPQPSQQFIEKFIEEYNKDNIITDVLVEYETLKTTANNKHFGEGHIYSITNKLKINPYNTITIKKLKDSWDREEVIELLKLAWKESDSQYDQDDWVFNGEDEINIITYFEKNMNKWINEIL